MSQEFAIFRHYIYDFIAKDVLASYPDLLAFPIVCLLSPLLVLHIGSNYDLGATKHIHHDTLHSSNHDCTLWFTALLSCCESSSG
jgi:hypothetical protein